LFFIFFILSPASVWSEKEKIHEILVLKDTYRFSPEVVHISIGDTIKWVNHDIRMHQFASVPGSGPTGELEFICDEVEPDNTCQHTFTTSGEFPYFCFIHKQMLGLVIVGN
jgi:plastocyanin